MLRWTRDTCTPRAWQRWPSGCSRAGLMLPLLMEAPTEATTVRTVEVAMMDATFAAEIVAIAVEAVMALTVALRTPGVEAAIRGQLARCAKCCGLVAALWLMSMRRWIGFRWYMHSLRFQCLALVQSFALNVPLIAMVVAIFLMVLLSLEALRIFMVVLILCLVTLMFGAIVAIFQAVWIFWHP
ncbi:unnamed protein product [Prorocentrum cordatum]|uniref:Transmembrane protein 138 n=1 Tax=Prorocentrum cordatum TaxID=2364126 RepID=A0ABN9VXY5_9DINO|nr:unnamed protein product [Polarella glacialis]